METLLASALFWQQIFTPVHHSAQKPVVRTTRERSYVPVRATREERNMDFYRQHARKKPRTNLRLQKTHVVIAPHPDDEILCCGAVLREAVESGDRVKIIYLTDGDGLDHGSHGDARAYGFTRKKESITAAKFLGIPKSSLYFLGFPDGHLDDLDELGSVQSSYTLQNKSSFSSHFPATPYTRKNLKNNLTKLLQKLRPDVVYLPSLTKDKHPDHQVSARFVREILAEKNMHPELKVYTVHGRRFWTQRSQLDRKKLRLIRVFQSQFHDDYHMDFLERFARYREVFD